MIAKLHKTRQTRVLNTIYTLTGGALLLVLFLYFRTTKYDAVISINNIDIPVTLANTDQKREQGLSNTEFLVKNTGKLFVFNTVGNYGFWMKDMNYPIDILWIDKDKKIIGISRDLKPESYPEIFYPPSDVKYVLEVNAGFSTSNNIQIDQLIRFPDNSPF